MLPFGQQLKILELALLSYAQQHYGSKGAAHILADMQKVSSGNAVAYFDQIEVIREKFQVQ